VYAAPTLRPAPRPNPKPAKKKMPWPGWLELIVVSQTALPAMMFVPAHNHADVGIRAAPRRLGGLRGQGATNGGSPGPKAGAA
jgi:hypothetical protein